MNEMPPDLISAYLDGECTEDERAAVEARVATDPEWRDELEQVRAARDAVRALPLMEVPDGCWDAVARAIAAADAADDTRAPGNEVVGESGAVVPMRASHRWRYVYGALGTAAAGVAAVFALVFVLPAPPGDRPVRPPIAALADVHDARAASVDEPLTRVVSASLTGPTGTGSAVR